MVHSSQSVPVTDRATSVPAGHSTQVTSTDGRNEPFLCREESASVLGRIGF